MRFELLPQILYQSMCNATICIMQQMANIPLSPCQRTLTADVDLCTVHTTMQGAYEKKFVLCAERRFLHRMTECMMGEPMTGPEDLEEYTKEFFNVLCGHLVGDIFRQTKLGASFHAPSFVEGYYTPAVLPTGIGVPICFASDQNELLTVLHD